MRKRGTRSISAPLFGLVLLIAAVALLTLACGQDAASPIPSPAPTQTATAGPAPSPTPAPTSPPTLSPTPIATPTAVPSPPPSPTPTATPPPTPSPTAAPSDYPLTIESSDGRLVTLTEPPERIVAIDGAAVEILFAMGEGRRVVGTHDFVSYPPETADIEKVGSAFALNLEKIAALDPDLVYIFFGSPVPGLEALGVPVIYLDSPTTLQGVVDQVRMWGDILDAQDASELLASRLEASIARVKQAVASVDKGPRVFFLGDPTLWTAGEGTLIQDIFTLLKATNIFADISGFAQVSPEEILARDPDVVLAVYSVGPDPEEVINASPALQTLSAVKAGKIFRANADLLSTAGPRLVQGLEEVAGILYPDLFP